MSATGERYDNRCTSMDTVVTSMTATTAMRVYGWLREQNSLDQKHSEIVTAQICVHADGKVPVVGHIHETRDEAEPLGYEDSHVTGDVCTGHEQFKPVSGVVKQALWRISGRDEEQYAGLIYDEMLHRERVLAAKR